MTKPFSMDAFKAWLTERGAIVDPPTNPYEILSARTADGVLVAYRDSRGKETWPTELTEYRDAWKAGQQPSLSPDLRSRVKLRHRVQELAERDGLWCWFCETGFLSVDSREITIEHLVPLAHGGPNHVSNLVLACGPCNRRAGNLPVSAKVRLRDEIRLACTAVGAA